MGVAHPAGLLRARQLQRQLLQGRQQALRQLTRGLVHGLIGCATALGAQRRQVVELGVRQAQEIPHHLGVATHMQGLLEHGAVRVGQRGIRVVGIAPGQAVGQVVALAALVLRQDLPQVQRLGLQHLGGQPGPVARLPRRQHQP